MSSTRMVPETRLMAEEELSADDAWHTLSDPHDNGNCNGHATYDATAHRLYVTDDSHRVWFYQY